MSTSRMYALRQFFTDDEILQIELARRQVDPQTATIVYCLYENPFARSGGLFPVAERYTEVLQNSRIPGAPDHDRRVIVISPYHGQLANPPDLKRIGACSVIFRPHQDAVKIECSLREHYHRGVRWILLETPEYFLASGGSSGTDPYVYNVPGQLLTDSLFLCAAVPPAIRALEITDNIILHVQDWELASTALTAKLAILDGALKSVAVVLTSHNPYDGELHASELARLTDRAYRTVYQTMIPLMDAPVTTVSRTFAHELTHHPLHTTHFADHLQRVYREQGVIGIDNGLFGAPTPPFLEAVVAPVRAEGNIDALRAEKLARRFEMIRVLRAYQDERTLGDLHWQKLEEDVRIPVFLMFGRLDPRQKGFDVLARAIERTDGQPVFVIAANVGNANDPNVAPFLEDLRQLAQTNSGRVIVYPFRLEHGYAELVAGASFAVMPSLYEPFGAATEAYLKGTPVIARRTGGLVQQVIDIREDRGRGTGLLFSEADKPYPVGDWKAIQSAGPRQRMEVALYEGIVEALAESLRTASHVYSRAFDRDPEMAYWLMLTNLEGKLREFSWEQVAQQYRRVYELATR